MLELFLGGKVVNTTTVIGEIIFSAGVNGGSETTRSWVVPKNVYSVSAVLVGEGGGGYGSTGDGGDLRWVSEIPVTPGETLTITVGTGAATTTDTTLKRNSTLLAVAKSGKSNTVSSLIDNVLIGGGNGGKKGFGLASNTGGATGGGGGAGGYLGDGGAGWNSTAGVATAGVGGGGGGGCRCYVAYSSQYIACAGVV